MNDSAELVLVDLSSIAYPIYLTTQSHPDADKASQEIVARVRALAHNHPHVAICCDRGRSFRHDLVTSYKANRPPKDEPLRHQIALACAALKADGFPVWSAPGFEADDIIATATARALALPDLTVLIVSSDKDLLQLVGPRVRAKSARDGAIVDEAGVMEKFGVTPAQMRDYLTLVGDKSDNIKGATGIGEKKAAQLLATFETLDNYYAAVDKGEAAQPAAIMASLAQFRSELPKTRALVTLRTDVEIPFDEIAADRVPQDADLTPPDEADEEAARAEVSEFSAVMHAASAPRPAVPSEEPLARPGESASTSEPAGPSATTPDPGTAIAPFKPVEGTVVPVEYERQLDPRSMRDAQILAENMHKSRMFSSYGSAPAVLSTIMVGRELGLPAMASLRSIHNIEGRHGLAAQLMVALILKSGFAEYFEPVDFDEQHATYTTHRKGARNPVTLTHTIEMAWKAWPKGKATDQRKIEEARAAFEASGWGRNPTDMLVARATSRLARMVYPDLMAGLYTPEELEEIRRQEAA